MSKICEDFDPEKENRPPPSKRKATNHLNDLKQISLLDDHVEDGEEDKKSRKLRKRTQACDSFYNYQQPKSNGKKTTTTKVLKELHKPIRFPTLQELYDRQPIAFQSYLKGITEVNVVPYGIKYDVQLLSSSSCVRRTHSSAGDNIPSKRISNYSHMTNSFQEAIWMYESSVLIHTANRQVTTLLNEGNYHELVRHSLPSHENDESLIFSPDQHTLKNDTLLTPLTVIHAEQQEGLMKDTDGDNGEEGDWWVDMLLGSMCPHSSPITQPIHISPASTISTTTTNSTSTSLIPRTNKLTVTDEMPLSSPDNKSSDDSMPPIGYHICTNPYEYLLQLARWVVYSYCTYQHKKKYDIQYESHIHWRQIEVSYYDRYIHYRYSLTISILS